MKALIFFLLFVGITLIELSAQNSELKRGKFKTWYNISTTPFKEKGLTFDVQDSSVTLIRTVYYKPNSNFTDYSYLVIPYKNIKTFKARRSNSILLGTAVGTMVGVGIGLLAGYTSTSKEDVYRGIAIGGLTVVTGVLGLGLGAAIGSAKVIIPINGNKETFVKMKPRLEKYSIKKN